MRDAPRHRSVPHCILKRGRRASRTACRRGASHDSRDYGLPTRRRTIVEIIVPHAPVDCPQEVGHQSDLMGVFKWPSIQSNSNSPSSKRTLK
ncbi:DUF1534 domain-containing protein, partial [Pseudomonas syringae]|nr:DUF1534 domain-containing protein [Pseudomonas syringae]MCF5272049.1 DUF1534 domain-containing protein [Pseudomonas syringae]MCF5358359.1 DUF1534 domain-containing protein [Pseudomonas syringae]MCF5375048.1 DUF1534 domain-containing protein [Pseudomonas syringae]MCF5408161.1 DUF1534 domain-containing protein [Pseudomonas syringae]